jgi:hypothetical protein
MLGFRSTVDYPSPSLLPHGSEKDDIAAVLAGTKPSAVIPNSPDLTEDEVFQALLRIAALQGVHVEIHDGDYLMIGDRRTVGQLKECYDGVLSDDKNDKAERSAKLGKLLGYCDEAIHDFVEFGIKRGMTYHEREFRRKLHRVSA